MFPTIILASTLTAVSAADPVTLDNDTTFQCQTIECLLSEADITFVSRRQDGNTVIMLGRKVDTDRVCDIIIDNDHGSSVFLVGSTGMLERC